MATMWPRKLTPTIIADPGRRAELKVFQKLEEVLEDPFTVFYSRPWLGTTASGQQKDGECDFVVAHPNYGFLVIEVKGGAVSYDPISDTWTSRDHNGSPFDIKNPARQAVESKHQILKKCQAHPNWGGRRVSISHGIIFPDAESIPGDLGADMPHSIICFMEEFETGLRSWIIDIMEREISGDYRLKPLGPEGIKILEDLLAHPIQLHIPLQRVIEDDERTISTLTPLQFQILTGLAEHKRVAISGSAGTGKTILAMEEALRCNNTGERVLLTCYNRPLSEFMQTTLGERQGLTIQNYHRFCDEIFLKAGIAIDRSRIDNTLFLEQYPKYLAEALTILPDVRFDTIIIDEGQDFPPGLLKSLELALDPKGKGKIRLFYDNNQDVYHNQGKYLENLYENPFVLTLNLRNTKKIHDLTRSFYTGKDTIAIGPDGHQIEWITAETLLDVRKSLNDYVQHLIEKEHIPATEIAVLISTRNDKEKYSLDGSIAGMKYQFCNDRFATGITAGIILDSVTRFKGLESSVVIVVLDDSLVKSDEKLYVAFSRARSLLAVIGKKADCEKIRSRILRE